MTAFSFRLILSLLALVGGTAFAVELAPRRVDNFNSGWKFTKGAQPGAEAAGFDHSAWEAVRLPHDWAIRGPYDIQGEPRSGKLSWRGEGWYRKSFSLPATDAGMRIRSPKLSFLETHLPGCFFLYPIHHYENCQSQMFPRQQADPTTITSL